jgi:hypothetical protein
MRASNAMVSAEASFHSKGLQEFHRGFEKLFEAVIGHAKTLLHWFSLEDPTCGASIRAGR